MHIYQGEALGIIGEPGSLKTLIGRILSGSVKPDKGKVVRTKTYISGDIDDRKINNLTVSQYVSELVQLFPYEVTEHKVEQIIQWAHLGDYIEEKVSKAKNQTHNFT